MIEQGLYQYISLGATYSKRGVNDLLISFLALFHLRNVPFRRKSPGNEVAIHYPGTLLCPVVGASTKSSLACYLKITAVFLVIHTIITVKWQCGKYSTPVFVQFDRDDQPRSIPWTSPLFLKTVDNIPAGTCWIKQVIWPVCGNTGRFFILN